MLSKYRIKQNLINSQKEINTRLNKYAIVKEPPVNDIVNNQ